MRWSKQDNSDSYYTRAVYKNPSEKGIIKRIGLEESTSSSKNLKIDFCFFQEKEHSCILDDWRALSEINAVKIGSFIYGKGMYIQIQTDYECKASDRLFVSGLLYDLHKRNLLPLEILTHIRNFLALSKSLEEFTLKAFDTYEASGVEGVKTFIIKHCPDLTREKLFLTLGEELISEPETFKDGIKVLINISDKESLYELAHAIYTSENFSSRERMEHAIILLCHADDVKDASKLRARIFHDISRGPEKGMTPLEIEKIDTLDHAFMLKMAHVLSEKNTTIEKQDKKINSLEKQLDEMRKKIEKMEQSSEPKVTGKEKHTHAQTIFTTGPKTSVKPADEEALVPKI